MHRTLFRAFAIGLAAILLAACSSAVKPCPNAAVLADASSFTAFPNGAPSPDPAHALYTVQMTGATTDCDYDKKFKSSDSSLDLSFRVSRTPNGLPVDASVPYFVAVTGEGGKILTREKFTVAFHLDAGETTTTFEDKVAAVHIDVARDKYPWDYQLLAGLELTKAQLDYNRTVGPYAP
ncbi:MAG: hypothetical protein WBQ17_14795 [Rhizomicrobium sp.]|jgi:hypothetical protein